MKNKYYALLKNTMVFAVGSFSSRVLSFFIVPLYTYYLTTNEYGMVDLILVSRMLFIPIGTLLIQEAAVRFIVPKEIDKSIIISNCMLIFLLGTITSFVFCAVVVDIFNFQDYYILFQVLMIVGMYNCIAAEYTRAIGAVTQFSFNGVLSTIITISSNILFLIVMRWGINGYLLSLLLAEIISACYLTWSSKIFDNFSIREIDISALKEMLVYSIPLIPNNIMWWIMNAGDKYIINAFLGNDANGVFLVAMKIPSVINVVFLIFFQAWQLSALEEKNSADRNEFFNNVFSAMTYLLAFISVIIIGSAYPLYAFLFSEAYISGCEYVPVLVIAVFLNCVSTFLGIAYIISKKSKKAFLSTAMGAFANVVLNFILIQHYSLFGVAIATAMGYFVVCVVRWIDFERLLLFELNLFEILIIFSLLIIEILVLFYTTSVFANAFIVLELIGFLLMFKRHSGLIIRLFNTR